MNNLKILVILSILILSCGGSEAPLLEPERTKINGPLSDYLEVVKGEYEIIEDWGARISIKLKALKSYPEDLNNKEIELSLMLLNDKGIPVTGTDKLLLESDEKDKLINLIKTGSGEDVFKFRSYSGDYKQDEHGEKVKKFTLTSTINEVATKEKSESTTNIYENDNESILDETTLSDCEQFLNDYEAFANNYIKFMNEYKNNPYDLSILNEYAEMVEKASQMQSKAKNCVDPKFAQRILEITNKITSAVY